MAVKTQGTEMWFVLNDSHGYSIAKVQCPTGIQGLGGARNQIDITCLDDEEMQYVGGMPNPGTLTANINFDGANVSHQELLRLFKTGDTTQFIIGFRDGTAPPTINNSTGILTFPTTRTYLEFDGYVSDFPFDFTINSVVKTAMQIQRSGPVNEHFKV